ncbi:hypothetical protein BCR39DRAFT_468557 [Naematelia encephala]|uniref:Fe2OG dioxygenase domain-containing protein n=1 Tax=Naematelia encephala TaxID=71784 RepID=A0A1Y2B051_9TREE|nr:hypothetical protein BCR39DRAFT_468557 [Naematelia encephala]
MTSNKFNPPAADLPGKPSIPDWVPPALTKEKLDFAKLRTIDLSLVESDDPKVVDELVQITKKAIREDGFLFIENYGVSLEQLHRQFTLAQYLHYNISEEDQERLLFHPEISGKWAGYKHPWGFKRERKVWDGITQFNWYSEEWADYSRVPTCILPFMDEIRAFNEFLSESVNRRILILLSKVLELPENYLWDKVQSHGGPTGEGYYRHALFRPFTEEAEKLSKGLRFNGHCDYGTTTLLFSVPVTQLQIWGQDEVWRYVPYKPGAIVINIGETLEIVSGGHFKATRHRVFKPPMDQINAERLSIVQFNSSVGDLRMTPAIESPLIQREGFADYQGAFREFQKTMASGIPIPTNRQWREIQIAETVNTTDVKRQTIGGDWVMHDGKLMNKREFHGVTVILPV